MTDQLRTRAIDRLTAKTNLRWYLLLWLFMSVLLIGIWALTNPGGYFWPVWPIGGVGVGAVFKTIGAYGYGRREISDERVSEEMARMARRG